MIDPAEKDRLQAALWTLFEHGDAGERAISLSFWGATRPPLEVADGLAAAYLASPDDRVGSAIGDGLSMNLSEGMIDALVAKFVAEPTQHTAILPLVCRLRPRGATWDALVALTKETKEAIPLYRLSGGVWPERKREWFALLRGRPADVLAKFKSYIGHDSERLLDEVLAEEPS